MKSIIVVIVIIVLLNLSELSICFQLRNSGLYKLCKINHQQIVSTLQKVIPSVAIISSSFLFHVDPCLANAIVNNGNGENLTVRQKVIRQTESFLTNPVLESIRKIDQLDPDAESQFANKVILLVPIIEMNQDIEKISSLINTKQSQDLTTASSIIHNPKFETANFKKTFNRYSDNIFYSDPKQANLYLAGGAMPNSRQTQQYLFRNAALTSIDDIKEDLALLLKSATSNSNSNDNNNIKTIEYSSDQLLAIADAVDDCREALDSLTHYFELADPQDVQVARSIVYTTAAVGSNNEK